MEAVQIARNIQIEFPPGKGDLKSIAIPEKGASPLVSTEGTQFGKEMPRKEGGNAPNFRIIRSHCPLRGRLVGREDARQQRGIERRLITHEQQGGIHFRGQTCDARTDRAAHAFFPGWVEQHLHLQTRECGPAFFNFRPQDHPHGPATTFTGDARHPAKQSFASPDHELLGAAQPAGSTRSEDDCRDRHPWMEALRSRRCPPWRPASTAWTSARMASAIPSGASAPRSSPIGK